MPPAAVAPRVRPLLVWWRVRMGGEHLRQEHFHRVGDFLLPREPVRASLCLERPGWGGWMLDLEVSANEQGSPRIHGLALTTPARWLELPRESEQLDEDQEWAVYDLSEAVGGLAERHEPPLLSEAQLSALPLNRYARRVLRLGTLVCSRAGVEDQIRWMEELEGDGIMGDIALALRPARAMLEGMPPYYVDPDGGEWWRLGPPHEPDADRMMRNARASRPTKARRPAPAVIARVYLQALEAGSPPTLAVMEHFGLASEKTAQDYTRTARKAGLIPATVTGYEWKQRGEQP